MKVAIFSESPADEAALRILTNAVLGFETVAIEPTPRMRRGWSFVLRQLPVILRSLHYQSEADGLVVVVDSDSSPPHVPTHDVGAQKEGCRLCALREVVRHTLSRLKHRPHLEPLKLAFGLAVPCLEAWLLFGRNKQVAEAAWLTGTPGYDSKKLKIEMYGAPTVGLAEETQRMVAEANRIAQKLDELTAFFPAGFGALRDELRSWRGV